MGKLKTGFILTVLLAVMLGFLSYTDGNSITTSTTYEVEEQIPEEENKKPIVLFCPRDDCLNNLIYLIENSGKIHCALFDLDLPSLIDALKRNKAKVVIDKNNYQDSLSFTKQDNNNQLSHNKFCVFDDEIVWTGSFNPTERGNFKNNNNVVILFSKLLAENYEAEFQELWNMKFGKGEKVKHPKIKLNNNLIENYFCPEDGCAEKVIKILEKANESIYFMTFSFTHNDIGDLLIEKNKEIEIRGVFEKTQQNDYSEHHKFKDMDVGWDGNKYKMHHKVFIIDKKIVITGSFNPTKSGDSRNDENVMIIHDKLVANNFLTEFNKIYQNSTSISE